MARKYFEIAGLYLRDGNALHNLAFMTENEVIQQAMAATPWLQDESIRHFYASLPHTNNNNDWHPIRFAYPTFDMNGWRKLSGKSYFQWWWLGQAHRIQQEHSSSFSPSPDLTASSSVHHMHNATTVGALVLFALISMPKKLLKW